MKPAALLARLLWFRRSPGLALAAISALLAVAFTVLSVGAGTLRSSALQSVAVANAGFGYLAQSEDTAGTEALRRAPGLLPVEDSTGYVSRAGRTAAVAVRTFADPAATPGLLLAGRRPTRADEAVLSRSVSAALGAAPGSTVQLHATERAGAVPVTVSGVTVDPGNRDALSVAVLVSTPPPGATTWLSRRDPAEQPGLRPLYESRTLHGRTTRLLAADSFANGPLMRTYGAAERALPGVFVLGIALVGVLVAAMTRELTPTVAALTAAGFARRRAWALLGAAAGTVVLLGTVGGVVFGVAGLALVKVPVSAPLGQYWTRLAVAWIPLSLYATLLPPMALVTARLTSVRFTVRLGVRHRLPRIGWGIASVALGLGLLTLTYLQLVDVTWALVATIAVVLGSVFLAQHLALAGMTSAERQLTRGAGRGVLALAATSVIVAVATGIFAAGEQQASDLVRQTANPLQPTGSVLVLDVNEPSHGRLAETFERLGGTRESWLETPDETRGQLRVTSPTMVACLRATPRVDSLDLPARCIPAGAAVAPNVVLLSTGSAVSDVVHADPALIERGQVGLIDYEPGTSHIRATRVVSAVADRDLGGNVAGAVVAPGSSTAREYGLRPSGSGLFAMFGVDHLAPTDQSRLRNAVIRFAPTAQVAESGGINDEGSRGRSVLVSGVAAVLLAFLFAAGSWSLLASQLRLRQTLAELGIPRRRRMRFAARLFCVPVLANLVGLGATTLAIWLLAAREFPSAWWWTAPGFAAIVGSAAAVIAYSRVRPVAASD